MGENCYTAKKFCVLKYRVIADTLKKVLTQAWHSDCARMRKKLDLDLSHGRLFPFHHFTKGTALFPFFGVFWLFF